MPPRRGIDAPALPRGIAGPDERDRAPRRGRGAEMPDLRLACDAALADVVEAHAIENILPRRQAIEQHFRGEVAVRQGIGGHAANDGPETLDASNIRPASAPRGRRAPRSPRTRPRRRPIEFRWRSADDPRRGSDRVWRGCRGRRRDRGRRADQQLTPCQRCLARIAIGIEQPSSNHDEGVPEQFDSRPKVLRQVDDSTKS